MRINQIKAGAVLNYVIIFLNAVVGLLYTPYLLRCLGQSEYGLYSLVVPIVGYLTILDFGFGNAVIRYTAKFRAEGKQKEQYEMFGMFVILYSVIALVAFIVGLILYFNVDTLFGDTLTTYELSRTKILMLILVFNLAITFPFSIFGSIITAYEDFVFQKTINIARIILNTVVMIVLLHQGYKAVALVVVQTIFNISTLLLNYWYCKHKIKISFIFRKFNWSFLKEVAIYSFWLFLNAIMDKIYWSTGQFVLGAVSGAIAVAVFGVAIQLEAMYMTFSTAIVGVLLPKVTSMVVQNNNDKAISDLFVKTGRIQYIIMAFILSGFILFGKPFINLWAGNGYEESYIIALLFFIPLTIPLIQNLGITILQARNQMKFRSVLYVIIAVIALILEIILGRLYGGIGCAVAIAGALILGHIIVMNIYYWKVQHLDILRFWKEIIKMSVTPVLICFIAFILINKLSIDFSSVKNLALGMIAFSAVYIPLFWKFSMNKYERQLLLKPIKQRIQG